MNAKPIEGKGYDPNGRHVRPLAKQVGEAAFWNVLMLPLQALLSLAYALLIRRWFGLFSGVLDVLIGLLKALNLYSDLGVLRGLPKFIPEINASTGPKRLLRFLGRVITIRLFVLIVFLAVLNVLAESIANRFALGANGITYLRLLSGLALASAVHDLIITTLNSFFGQLWSNVLSLVQGLCNLLFVVLVLSFGFEISGVLSALLLSTVIVACIASARAFWILKNNDENHSNKTTPAPAFPYLFETSEKDLKRFFHFTGTMYVIGLPSIFVTLSFASPTIGLVLNLEEVALFSTAFNLVLSSVTFVVGGFRGIYRPLLARLRIRADARQTQLAYLAITKAQLLLLIPGAFGLAVLCGEYIPLLFGNQFLGAVPVARILVFLLYAETAFNLPSMMLTIDEQYKAMAWRKFCLSRFCAFVYCGNVLSGCYWRCLELRWYTRCTCILELSALSKIV